MSETERIAEQLERTWTGDAWHGPAMKELTAGLTAKQAATPHVSEAHSIWEIVLHCTRVDARGRAAPRRERPSRTRRW